MSRSINEGASFSLMVALGETYFPAFAIASGLGDIAAGLITTLPLLLGALLQLNAPKLLPYFGSHRRWVLCFTSLQGITFVPLIYGSLQGGTSLMPLFLCSILYTASGMLAGPVWSGWISNLIPSRLHPHFFARRNRRMQIAHVVGFLCGGLLLHVLDIPNKNAIFAGLFSIALLARIYSIYNLYLQPTLEHGNEFAHTTGAPGFGWHLVKENPTLAKTVLYLLLFQFGVGIAGPFFTPFMLSGLKLNYLQYTMLVLSCFLGKIIALPASAKRFRKVGPEPFFRINGTAIALIPLLFVLAPNFYSLLVLQFIAGVLWSGFELVSFVHLVGLFPKKQRTAFFTYYQFGNAMAVSVSSLVGGFFLREGGTRGFLWVFALSTIVRLAAQTLLVPKHKINKREALRLISGGRP